MSQIMPEIIWLLLLIGAIPVIRLLVGVWNHARIREYIDSRGGSVVSIKWKPFGLGWFGERDSVIYLVTYRDGEGDTHEAYCKTNFFSGVYFSEDRIISRATRKVPMVEPPTKPPLSSTAGGSESPDFQSLLFENLRLKEENRRLKEELERLRQ